MVRPKQSKRVGFNPEVVFFKPRGIPKSELEQVVLRVEEFESLRLKDYQNLDQNECAEKMDISQPTFHRLISSARKKVAEALTLGKALKIEGGNFIYDKNRKVCKKCKREFNSKEKKKSCDC